MEKLNIFSAQGKGRIDVGSTAFAMFVYDVPAGEASAPYDGLLFRRDSAVPLSERFRD